MQEKHLVELHHAGAHTASDLAELFGVESVTPYTRTDVVIGSRTSPR